MAKIIIAVTIMVTITVNPVLHQRVSHAFWHILFKLIHFRETNNMPQGYNCITSDFSSGELIVQLMVHFEF